MRLSVWPLVSVTSLGVVAREDLQSLQAGDELALSEWPVARGGRALLTRADLLRIQDEGAPRHRGRVDLKNKPVRPEDRRRRR